MAGTNVPTLMRAESRFAREDDRLIALLDADLVEDACDVVAHGFLRQAERFRDLGVVLPAGDAFEHVALLWRKVGKRQHAARPGRRGGRLGEEALRLLDD